MKEQSMEQNQRENRMSFISKVIVTGFIGGILWSCIGYVAYIFNFTQISPKIILQPWAKGKWQDNWQGFIFTILLIGVISIGAALIYYALCRKINSMWAGVLFGVALFFIIIFLFQPLFPDMKPMKKLSSQTIITSICLYMLYGLFVGYSISYEQNEFHQNG